MNLISYCINEVINGANDISEYSLKLAFDNPNRGLGFPTWMDQDPTMNTIENGIREKVIYKMIAPKLQVNGGVTELIDLGKARVEYMGNGDVAVNVPDSLTGGREIVSVIAVYPGNIGSGLVTGAGNSGGAAVCDNGGGIGAAMNRVVNGLSANKGTGVFTRFTPAGRNSFIIRDAGIVIFTMTAKVLLGYDEEFTIIPKGAYDYFSELVTLGTKAYIYKNTKMGMREAADRYGVSFDDLRDEINGFSDAHKEFNELFNEHIVKVLKYADRKGVADSLAMLGPRRVG